MSDVLILHSRSLASKYGFNDGDEPDHLLDWLDVHHPEYDYATADWHPTLIRLVETYLLPALKEDVEILTIDTIHNPVRAARVNGNDLVYEDDLEEATVAIPFEDVWKVIEEIGNPRSGSSP